MGLFPPSSQATFRNGSVVLSAQHFQLLYKGYLPRATRSGPNKTLSPLIPPNLLRNNIRRRKHRKNRLRSLLLIPRHSPRGLRHLTTITRNFLLPPLPINLSMLNIMFNSVIFGREVRMIPLNRIRVALRSVLSHLSSQRFKVANQGPMCPTNVVLIRSRVLRLSQGEVPILVLLPFAKNLYQEN